MDLVFQIIFTGLGAFLSVVLTRLLIENGRAIRELGNRMDAGFRRMDQGFRKMDAGLKRMDERTEKIAQLIVAEGKRTRKILKD